MASEKEIDENRKTHGFLPTDHVTQPEMRSTMALEHIANSLTRIDHSLQELLHLLRKQQSK